MPTDEAVPIRKDDHAVGIFREVMIQRVKTRATAAYLDDVSRLEQRMLATYPNGYFVLVLVDEGVELPSADVRTRSSDLLQKREQTMLGHAFVIRGGGFWASAMRGALTGIFAVVRKRAPRKAFESEDDAVRFAAEALGYGPAEEQGLRETVARVLAA